MSSARVSLITPFLFMTLLGVAVFTGCDTSETGELTPSTDAGFADSAVDANGNGERDGGGPDAGSTQTSDAAVDDGGDGGGDDGGGDGGGDGGDGGGCSAPTDCPAPSTACKTNTCSGGACGTADAPPATPCTDSGGAVCDGAGVCVQCITPADCPSSLTTCQSATCDGNACGVSNASQGTDCSDNGGVVCDGNGACVAAHCNDGLKDADESDEDCGGSCGPCNDTKHCKVDADCASKVCDPSEKTCAPASCVDGVQNGDETGTDCGGATCVAQSKRCANDSPCSSGDDCQTGYCDGTCKPMQDGSACSDNAQCASGKCGVNGKGNCCKSACGGGPCGATGCDGAGACVYPGTNVVVPPYNTPGDCQSIVCNGNGGVTSVDDATDQPFSWTVCVSGLICCGSPLSPCFDIAPAGTDCTADGVARKHVCSDPSLTIGGMCVECNYDVDCLALDPSGILVCNWGVCQ